ncbi:PF09594 family protein [Leptospira wolbachii serovar Codice str. CDC]|uniref:PF09594 family protein n=1 Tax=Leptospira wolbachii serovar Codice str. CDC TaxID=1218599 RepID=R8ZYC5_9LEPT|nr:glycosyltransferase family 87 protein [Leptospira wolbachii]EOQ94842.1 PF09594 family protein [Leptospira wolbachii serovar Codice str. CDC]
MWKFLETLEKRGKWILCILLVIFLVLSVSRSKQKSDFLDYYHAAKRWATGENLYRFDAAFELQSKVKTMEDLFQPENFHLLTALQNETATYIYPPLFSFLLIPFTYLTEPNAALLFELLSWISLLAILYLIFQNRELSNSSSPFPYLILLATLVFNFRFLESHIQNNQVGLLLILLVLVSLTAKSHWQSGILLALAVSIKITPLVFIFLYVYEKQYKRILWFLIGIFLWNAIPLLYHWDYTIQMTNEWLTEILGNAFSNPLLRSWKNNQSLSSTLAKYFVPGADMMNQPTYGLPFITLSLPMLKIIQLVFMVLFGIPLLLLWRKENKKWEIISLLFLVSALFSGISWIHSFIICLIPIYFILNQVISSPNNKKEMFVLILILSLPLLAHRTFVGSKIEAALSMFSILFYTTSLLYFYIVRFALRETENRN